MARRFDFFVFLFLIGTWNAFISASELSEYREKNADFQKRYETEILRLMEWAKEQGLEEDAEETRSLNHTPANEDQFCFGILPQEVQNPDLIQSNVSNSRKSGRFLRMKNGHGVSQNSVFRRRISSSDWLRPRSRMATARSVSIF